MTKSISDISNAEHNSTAEAKKSLMYGKTSGGTYLPIAVNTSGEILTNAGSIPIYVAEDYDILPDNNDMTTLLNNLLQDIFDENNGGIILFSSGTYRFDGQIFLISTTSDQARQPPIIWQGNGATASGKSTITPSGGTVFDMRYTGGYGKIITRGVGSFAVRDIIFKDGGSAHVTGTVSGSITLHAAATSNLPTIYEVTATASIFTSDMVGLHLIFDTSKNLYPIAEYVSPTVIRVYFDASAESGNFRVSNTTIHSTGTTLHINRCAFIGKGAGATAADNMIVLGGYDGTEPQTNTWTNDNLGFQGYGTVIENCFFNYHMAAVMRNTFANGVVVRDCHIERNGGGLAPFVCMATSNSRTVVGGVFSGNVIEETGYKYTYWMKNAIRIQVWGDSIYDPSTPHTAYAFYDSGCQNNELWLNYYDSTKTFISDNSSASVKTRYFQNHQGGTNYWGSTSHYISRDRGAIIGVEAGTSTKIGTYPFSLIIGGSANGNNAVAFQGGASGGGVTSWIDVSFRVSGTTGHGGAIRSGQWGDANRGLRLYGINSSNSETVDLFLNAQAETISLTAQNGVTTSGSLSVGDELNVVNGIFISPTNDVYSQIGPNATNITASSTTDRLVVVKQSSSTSGIRQAGVFESLFTGTSASTSEIQALNAYAGTTSASTGNLTATTNGGGLRNRYVINHAGSGTVSLASVISAAVQGKNITEVNIFNVESSIPDANTNWGSLAGFRINVPTSLNSGSTLSTFYGLRITDIGPLMAAGADVVYAIALDGVGSINFNTPTRAGLEKIYSSNTGLMDYVAGTRHIFYIGSNQVIHFNTVESVFNDDSNDYDFRIEGNNDANLFFSDAGNDRIGIGMNNPAQKLDITGDLKFGAASGAQGSRLIGRGEHTSAPGGSLSTGEWELAIYDNGVSPVLRVRYNDGGTEKVVDLGPLV